MAPDPLLYAERPAHGYTAMVWHLHAVDHDEGLILTFQGALSAD